MMFQELLQQALCQLSSDAPQKATRFFKTAPGEYAAHDQFLGIPTPTLRQIVKQSPMPDFHHLADLLHSPFNEERALSLLFLIRFYDEGDASQRSLAYDFYGAHINAVNNWNLVDLSAPLVMGRHLMTRDKQILNALAASETMWHRRIAIVATWYFIRHQDLTWTFRLSEQLRYDTHDLMHKAVGWMLREAGKKDEAALEHFLNLHAPSMPRTMLRYAIERFSPARRRTYLSIKPIKKRNTP